MKKDKQLFYAEITDTFSGEANYCWVRRYKGLATSERGFLRKVAREYGGQWRASGTDQYDMHGACIRMFIDLYDAEQHDDYNTKEL